MIPTAFGLSFCMADHYNFICELSVNMLCSFFYKVVFFLNFKSSLQGTANIFWVLMTCEIHLQSISYIVQHNVTVAFIFKTESVLYSYYLIFVYWLLLLRVFWHHKKNCSVLSFYVLWNTLKYRNYLFFKC